MDDDGMKPTYAGEGCFLSAPMAPFPFEHVPGASCY